MIREKDLSKPTRDGLNVLQNINLILNYLYNGKTYEYDGRFYRMDGDFNPYIVPFEDDFKTPKPRGEDVIPMFQNDMFWNMLIEIAQNIDAETLEELKLEKAIVVSLN